MSLNSCAQGTGIEKDVLVEVRRMAREYTKKGMNKVDAERRAAAEMLESVREDIERVRDHLAALGHDVDVREEPVEQPASGATPRDDPPPNAFDSYAAKARNSQPGHLSLGMEGADVTPQTAFE